MLLLNMIDFYSIVCGECKSSEVVRFTTQPIDFNLPIICPCAKITSYVFLEKNDSFAAFCRFCCRISKIKLAPSGDRWEVWSNDGYCPACASAPVRISVVDEDLYQCDQCDIQFKVDSEVKKLLKNRYGNIKFANVISSVDSLRPGDHLSFGALERGKSAVLLEIKKNNLRLLNDERQEQLVKYQDLSTPIYRLEYLPHDRLALHQTLSSASENLSKSTPSQSVNFSIFLKTGLDQAPEDLCNVSVEKDTIVRQCRECGEPLCRSCIHDFTNLHIILSCSACDNLFQVLNTPSQHVHLTHQYGKNCSTENVERMHQLGVSDVVFYNDDELSVHYIIVGIDRKHEGVNVVKIASHEDEIGAPKIEEESFSFRDFIATKRLSLFRFLPLDCLPADRVIQRAIGLAERKTDQEYFSIFSSDSCSIAKWCKTDEIDNKYCHVFRKVYGYIPIGISTLTEFSGSVPKAKKRVLSLEWSNRKRFYRYTCTSSTTDEEPVLVHVEEDLKSNLAIRNVILFL